MNVLALLFCSILQDKMLLHEKKDFR